MTPRECMFCIRLNHEPPSMAVQLPDAFPVSPGHTLIVPRRHVADLFELQASERAAVWSSVEDVVRRLRGEHNPTGINVGINVGESAGQTIEHAHVHVIPRYNGDVPDPRGGVRWVIPDKAAYWT